MDEQRPLNDAERAEIVNKSEEILLRIRRLSREMQERILQALARHNIPPPHLPDLSHEAAGPPPGEEAPPVVWRLPPELQKQIVEEMARRKARPPDGDGESHKDVTPPQGPSEGP